MHTPWYKEPWAYLVFILPLSAVIAGISTYIIANTNPDTLVVGDYYKKGKSINLEVGKVKMAQKLGDQLYKEGYKGVFCMDFLIDTDDGTPYLGEINPRISGASPLTNVVTAHYGGVPLFLFHLLEFLDIDYKVDMRKIQNRWNE